MILTGLFLGVATVIGGIFIYYKLPKSLRGVLERNAWVTDLGLMFTIYLLFGEAIVSLIAAAVAGVLISLLLHARTNPEKYGFVRVLLDKVKETFSDVTDWMEKANEKYEREIKPATV